MRYTIKTLASWLRENIGLHPSPNDLVALLDGELAAPLASRVWTHLARCSVCRSKLENLEKGLRLFQNVDSDRSPQESYSEAGLSQLQRSMAALHHGTPEPYTQSESRTFAASPVYHTVIAELGIYLGPQAARKILKKIDQNDLNSATLAAAIEPVIASFLGRDTGLAVITRLLLLWKCMSGTEAPPELPI